MLFCAFFLAADCDVSVMAGAQAAILDHEVEAMCCGLLVLFLCMCIHSLYPNSDIPRPVGNRKSRFYSVLWLPEQCNIYFLTCNENCPLFALRRSLTRTRSLLPDLPSSSNISN